MATNISWRLPIAVAFTVVSVMRILCTNIADIPGQATSDDPNACFWFSIQSRPNVFRCCDGYYKIDETNLTEKCTVCPIGSYGFFCRNKCKFTCENDGTCNTVDGSCRCPARYFGNNCEYPCNCQNGATCMYDGKCSCTDGFYGELCQKNCLCPENSECDSETGECTCQDGFYGKSCLPCNCSNSEQCDPFSGLCSCRPGYYGEECDKQCSCYNGAHCSNDNPDRCKCSFGWIGSECTDCDTKISVSSGPLLCNNKCLHCYNGYMCSIEKGDCECSAGWQGKRCDEKCKSGFYGNNCTEVCMCQHGMCDHIIGICQCDNGWTGQHCEKPCLTNCLVCKDDICTSCKPGWTGELCSSTCKPGFFGDSCQQRCTECNCSTSISCHHVNGSCPDVVRCEKHKCKYPNARLCIENPIELECQDGWYGRFCNVPALMTTVEDVSQADRYDTALNQTGYGFIADESHLYHWTVNIACAIGVVGLVIGVTICIIRRKKTLDICGKSHSSSHEKGTPTSDNTIAPCMSTQSVSVTDNITESDSFIDTVVQRADSQQTPIYAAVSKHKKVTQQSNAIKQRDQDTESVQYDALIQSQATVSISKDDVIKANSFKGPYEIISLDKLGSNINSNENDTNYDRLEGICVQVDSNNDVDGAYELLNYPRQTDNH